MAKISYKDAGVDIHSGYKAVELIKRHAKSTYNDNVLGDLGSFGGLYSIAGEDLSEPVLVSGTDGVGTKLKYAFVLNKHNTIGIDCVAMCVNDIACQGAKPLIFLDYLAVGKLLPEVAEQIVAGVAEGCRQSGCALIGGETAEMPGFYSEGEYDIAGFCTGIASKSRIINGANIVEGDVLIGYASSGIHSNGYSLVRKLFGSDKSELEKFVPELNTTLGEALLTPTRIYVRTLLEVHAKLGIKGAAHITGGGFIENIPRMLPKGLSAKVNLDSYELPAIFKIMANLSGLDNQELYNTFNMGMGMVIAVSPDKADEVVAMSESLGEKVCILGSVVKGDEGVIL